MIEKKFFGSLNGENVYSFFLCSKQIEVEVLNYGGIIRSLKVLKGDNATDVVLGYDHLDGYVNGTCYYGAIIGRCSNRIDKGEFYSNGKKHIELREMERFLFRNPIFPRCNQSSKFSVARSKSKRKI